MSKPLIQLYIDTIGVEPTKVETLKAHASERKIYRLLGPTGSICGVENPYPLENRAFVYFAKHFKSLGLPVPEIFSETQDGLCYLEEDLGDETLFDRLTKERSSQDQFPKSIEELYGRALDILPRFQVVAGKTLDYSRCFQVTEFGIPSIQWDMNYFLESFLSKTTIEFDRDALKDDFAVFAMHVAEAPSDFFMYRDFQSRNIMIKNGAPYFIDFQGGRKGPLQYDLASILYQSSAQIPSEIRKRLCHRYVQSLQNYLSITEEEFLKYLDRFILIRMMQVLGTYGRQGLEAGKEYFTNSIPLAVKTIHAVAEREPIMDRIPELKKIFERLAAHEKFGLSAAH